MDPMTEGSFQIGLITLGSDRSDNTRIILDICDGSHLHRMSHYTLDTCVDASHIAFGGTRGRRHGNTWSKPHPSSSPYKTDRSVAPEERMSGSCQSS